MNSFQQVVCGVCAIGARPAVGHDGRLYIDGDVSPAYKKEIRRHKVGS